MDKTQELVGRLKDALRGPEGEEYTDAGMENAFFRWPVIERAILATLESRPAPTEERAREVLALQVEKDLHRVPRYLRGKGTDFYIRDHQGADVTALTAIRAMLRFAIETQPVAGGEQEIARLRREIINAPETADFMAGVPIEAAHQRERWGASHDAGKTPFDWFWLLGYLAQKAADAAVRGDTEKARHHTISSAAALANWHAALTGADTSMRPGIDPVERNVA